MDDILSAVKSTTHASNHNTEDAAFVIREAVQGSRETSSTTPPVISARPKAFPSQQSSVTSHRQALDVLRNEPDISTLVTTIRWLNCTVAQQELNLKLPGPLQARIIHTLIDSVLPSSWQALEGSGRKDITECLTSIAGLKALAAFLRRLLSQRAKPGSADHTIFDLLEALDMIVRLPGLISKLWSDLCALLPDEVRLDIAWKEVVNFFGSHVLEEIQHEAIHKLGKGTIQKVHLTMSAVEFASNILHLASRSDHLGNATNIRAAAKLFSKSFDIDCAQRECILVLARDSLTSARAKDEQSATTLTMLIASMQRFEKRRSFDTLLACLSSGHTSQLASGIGTISVHSRAAPGMAKLFHLLIQCDEELGQELSKSIIDVQQASKSSFVVRQASLLALSNSEPNELSALLVKVISTFGDQMFIDHGLVTRQEAMAHIILVGTNYLHRKQPTFASTSLRSGGFMQGISNRLAASSSRARWLGMIVSTAISRLVDEPDVQMNFGTSDMATPEAKRWLDLVYVSDVTGSLDDAITVLNSILTPQKVGKERRQQEISTELPIINGKRSFGPPRPPNGAQTELNGNRITELTEDDSGTDDGLKPYAKPDSDPEDSDEDATLVNRNKAKPPVYIRTLMVMLRDNENAEQFQLAVKHAAPLIRRKIGFGREVSDHSEELARVLSSLQDPFDTDDFEDLRLQALIALVLSNAPVIAPWMARQAFAKDYSIAQRSIMLTAIGLGGREMAGYKHEDELNRSLEGVSFPSKQLPDRMRAIYHLPGQPHKLEATIKSVEQAMIQPLALAAADQTTSHLDAVKIRKFSSRMSVERTKRKPIANELAKIFSATFFEPLLVSFHQETSAFGDASVYFSTPVLLSTFLKTLAILLHASGPVTLGLAQITADLWDTLLHLRVRAASDIMIMEAVLFSLLTLLEVNDNKQDLAQRSPKQIIETKEWAEMIFERTGGGALIDGEGEEARIRTLCAGILMRSSEIISAYQKVLLGGWSGI